MGEDCQDSGSEKMMAEDLVHTFLLWIDSVFPSLHHQRQIERHPRPPGSFSWEVRTNPKSSEMAHCVRGETSRFAGKQLIARVENIVAHTLIIIIIIYPLTARVVRAHR